MASIRKSSVSNLPSYELTAGGYRAQVCAELGGSCLQLTHLATGAQLLRTPATAEAALKSPFVYGTPFLFPPNRVLNGVYEFECRRYELPLNGDNGKTHLHGLIARSPFEVTALEAGNDSARIRMQFTADAEHPYISFPHDFRVVLTLTLDETGLSHLIEITNDSESNLPMGTGFHTTLNAPFMPDGKEEDCVFSLGVGTEWLLGEMAIPTGEKRETSGIQESLRTEGIVPCAQKLSNLFVRTGPAVLKDKSSGRAIEYHSDSALKFWMIYNADSKQKFICPEAQNWINTAANRADWPAEETGFMYLEPHKTFTARTRLCLK